MWVKPTSIGKVDLATTAKIGESATGPFVSGVVPNVFGGVYQIPQLVYAGPPFEADYVQLPDLQADSKDPTGYRLASRTYQIDPPTQFDPVQVNQLYIYTQQGVTGPNGEPVPGVTYFGYQWPEQVFLLNAGLTSNWWSSAVAQPERAPRPGSFPASALVLR